MRILIIEDHLPLAQALNHHFSDQGHAITVVHDGEAGHQFFTQEGFDLCILDINLPYLSGLEVLSSSALWREHASHCADRTRQHPAPH